ncbi:MAG: radical SAM protein, partial [Actinobacteria bacterium]|nr:radical SAM protein [Actinomycetota bacterium]
DAGVPCGVMIAPILPGINDRPEQLRQVVEAAIDAGATHVSPILLHLRPVVREHYMEWLGENYPDLVPRYEAMYARGSYAPSKDRNELGRAVGKIVRAKGGLEARAPTTRWARDEKPKPQEPKQLKLL